MELNFGNTIGFGINGRAYVFHEKMKYTLTDFLLKIEIIFIEICAIASSWKMHRESKNSKKSDDKKRAYFYELLSIKMFSMLVF